MGGQMECGQGMDIGTEGMEAGMRGEGRGYGQGYGQGMDGRL